VPPLSHPPGHPHARSSGQVQARLPWKAAWPDPLPAWLNPLIPWSDPWPDLGVKDIDQQIPVLTAYGLHTEQGKGKSNLVLRVGSRRSDATIFKFVPASLFISPFSHLVFGTYQSIPNLQSRKKLGSGIDGRGCLRRSAVAVSRYFVFPFFFLGGICWYQA
jgi:hypothetical protein